MKRSFSTMVLNAFSVLAPKLAASIGFLLMIHSQQPPEILITKHT
jgi:hypothetical protein